MLRGLEWRVGREQAGWEKGSSGSGNLNRMLWVLPEEAGGVWQGALPDMLPHAVFQAQRLLGQRRPHRSFFESFTRALIILCTSLAVVLSSISICDGEWLLADDRLFGLWRFCTASNQTELHCLRDLSQTWVASGMVVARIVATLAVVVAIFGLEFLIVSQVCEDSLAWQKWAMGSTLLLISFILSFGGLLSFLVLLRSQVTLLGLTLMFWSNFTASFLLFLNGISGLHINSITHINNSRHPWGLPTKV